jgi:hypothetical protein
VQHSSEGRRELGVGDGVGGGEVHGAGHVVVVDEEPHGVDLVGERDPAPPLPTRTKAAAEPEPRRRHHLREHSAVGAQHETRPGRHHPDARQCSQAGGRLPLTADVGEEAVARIAVLGEHFVAPVAVPVDAGCADEDPRLRREPGERLRQQRGTTGAALLDERLAFVGPALVADSRTGEMHDGLHALERPDVDGASCGIPAHRRLTDRRVGTKDP